jgi:hypothetical protein
MLSEISNMLKCQNDKIKTQNRQMATIQAELHIRDAPKLSSLIKNAGVRAHVIPLEQSKATFQEIAASLAAHATGKEMMSPAIAEFLKTKCDEGESLIDGRLQYHKDCNDLGFDVAKELLAMREMGERDAAALALENRAKKVVETKRKAQSEAAPKASKEQKSSKNSKSQASAPVIPAAPFWFPSPVSPFVPAPVFFQPVTPQGPQYRFWGSRLRSPWIHRFPASCTWIDGTPTSSCCFCWHVLWLPAVWTQIF